MYCDIWTAPSNQIDLSIPIKDREGTHVMLASVVNFLDDLDGCNYFFSCGTALGLVRDGKFIDWDTDIDIDILEPSEVMIQEIIENMLKLGFSFYRKLSVKGKFSQLVFLKEPYHSVDFCFWFKDGKYFLNDVPETLIYKRSHPVQIYNAFTVLQNKGLGFRVPANFDEYFSVLYGESWRIPNKYSNWFKNARDLKIDLNAYRLWSKLLWKVEHITRRLLRYAGWKK